MTVNKTKPKTRAAKAPKQINPVLAALEFIKPAQKDTVTDLASMSHCRLANGFAVAYNGILTMGHPIPDDLSVCPHTFRLINALKRVKSGYSVTQTDNDTLVVTTEKLRVEVPCMNPSALPHHMPDGKLIRDVDKLKAAFEAVNGIVASAGPVVMCSSVYIDSGSLYATDRCILVEYWHGLTLTNPIIVPKEVLSQVAATKLKLEAIGYSASTITFHFEGGAWIKSQLYSEGWPIDQIRGLLDKHDFRLAEKPHPELYEAVSNVHEFSDDGKVLFTEDSVETPSQQKKRASYKFGSGASGVCLDGKYLLFAQKHSTSLDLTSVDNAAYFYGEAVRGAIVKVVA